MDWDAVFLWVQRSWLTKIVAVIATVAITLLVICFIAYTASINAWGTN